MLALVAPRRSGYLPRRYEDRAGQTRAGASLAEHSCSLSSRQLWSFCPVFRPARGLRLQNRSGLASRQDLLLRALQSRTCKASLRLAKRPKKSMSAGTLTGVSNTLISWLVSLIRDESDGWSGRGDRVVDCTLHNLAHPKKSCVNRRALWSGGCTLGLGWWLNSWVWGPTKKPLLRKPRLF